MTDLQDALDSLYRPKGPLPLHLSDLKRDTLRWSSADRWHYLELITYLWSQGGFIIDDDKEIAAAAGIDLYRGWRDRVTLLRTKLTKLSTGKLDKIRVRNAEETRNISSFFPVALLEENGFLFQKRNLKDIAKAAWISQKRARAGHKGGSKSQANASADDKQMLSTPSPTPSPIEENTEYTQQQQHSKAARETRCAAPLPGNENELQPKPKNGPHRIDNQDRYVEVATACRKLMGSEFTAESGPVNQWLADGCDPELDIYPVLERIMAKRGELGPPNNFKYFTDAICEARDTRTTPLQRGKGNGSGSRNTARPDPYAGNRQFVEAAARLVGVPTAGSDDDP